MFYYRTVAVVRATSYKRVEKGKIGNVRTLPPWVTVTDNKILHSWKLNTFPLPLPIPFFLFPLLPFLAFLHPPFPSFSFPFHSFTNPFPFLPLFHSLSVIFPSPFHPSPSHPLPYPPLSPFPSVVAADIRMLPVLRRQGVKHLNYIKSYRSLNVRNWFDVTPFTLIFFGMLENDVTQQPLHWYFYMRMLILQSLHPSLSSVHFRVGSAFLLFALERLNTGLQQIIHKNPSRTSHITAPGQCSNFQPPPVQIDYDQHFFFLRGPINQ